MANCQFGILPDLQPLYSAAAESSAAAQSRAGIRPVGRGPMHTGAP